MTTAPDACPECQCTPAPCTTCARHGCITCHAATTPPTPCRTCGTTLTCIVGSDGYPQWIDAHGHALGPDPDLPEDPYAELNRLEADPTRVLEASALRIRLTHRGSLHTHRPAP